MMVMVEVQNREVINADFSLRFFYSISDLKDVTDSLFLQNKISKC